MKFTLTTLTKYLNDNFKKKTGKDFIISDVQGYIRRGRLPKYLGDIRIGLVKFDGAKIYKLITKNNQQC